MTISPSAALLFGTFAVLTACQKAKISANDAIDIVAGISVSGPNGPEPNSTNPKGDIRGVVSALCNAFAKSPWPRKCGWNAEEIADNQWRITAYMRGQDVYGKQADNNYVWLFNPATMRVQPQNISAFVLLRSHDRNFKKVEITRLDCGSESCLDIDMAAEIDTLPWFRMTKLSGRDVAARE